MSNLDGFININGDGISALEFIFLAALLTLLPSIVVMMTSFTRYVISLSFLRNALGTQQTPPNMVLVGIALFLTLFTMGPTIDEINETAYAPYINGEIEMTEFFTRAGVPMKDFMLHPTAARSSYSVRCRIPRCPRARLRPLPRCCRCGW